MSSLRNHVAHSAFGLRIRSSAALPGLPVERLASGAFDLHCSLNGFPAWASSILPLKTSRYVSDSAANGNPPTLAITTDDDHGLFLLSFVDGARFLVNREGTRLWADWPPKLSLEDIAVYILGPVLGIVLRIRGTVCLHASAFVSRGRAVAIVGEGGAGKSTTVAALAIRGNEIVSDDVVALARIGLDWFAIPAYPHVKLWPSSSQFLFGGSRQLPRLVSTWEKEYLDLATPEYKFAARSSRVGAIFLLADRSHDSAAPFVETMSSRDALLALLGNSYGGGFLDSKARRDEFECMSDLVRRVPIRRLVPHANASKLGLLCELILTESHLIEAGVSEIRA